MRNLKFKFGLPLYVVIRAFPSDSLFSTLNFRYSYLPPIKNLKFLDIEDVRMNVSVPKGPGRPWPPDFQNFVKFAYKVRNF